MFLQAKLRIFGFLLLLGILVTHPISVEAITNIQFYITSTGHTSQGYCKMAYKFRANANIDDSGGYDYYGVVQWVHFPNSTEAVTVSVHQVETGETFAHTGNLNLVGNYQLYPMTFTVYELTRYPSYSGTLDNLLEFILETSPGIVFSTDIYPASYFSVCPPYNPRSPF